MLEGGGVYLCPFEQRDVIRVEEILSDKKKSTDFFMLNMPDSNISDWYEGYLNDSSTEFFVVRYQEEIIGVVGLSKIDHRNHSAELGVKGSGFDECIYGQVCILVLEYAFTDLKLNRVYGYSLYQVGNDSLFTKEAILYEAHFNDEGQFRDIMLLSRIRRDEVLLDEAIGDKC